MRKLIIVLAGILFLCSSCSNFKKFKIINTNFENEIACQQNLYFEFNEDMVDETQLNQWDSNKILIFEPMVSGQFMWQSKRTLLFSPSKSFLPATQYKAKINKNLKPAGKNKKPKKQSIEFHTPDFTIESSLCYWARNEHNLTDIELVANVNFNYKVSVDELKKSAEFILNGKKVDFKINSSGTTNSFDFVLLMKDYESAENTVLQLIIKPGIALENSEISSKQQIESEILIPNNDKLDIQKIESGSEQGYCYINVYTNQPVVTDNLKEQIQFEPSVTFDVNLLANGFTISGNFIEGTSYTLKLLENITSIFGKKLSQKRIEVINFASSEPFISFAHEGNIYLSSSGNRNLALNIVNVPNIKVSVFKVYENNIIHYLREGTQWDYYYDENDNWYDYSAYPFNENYGKLVFSREYLTKSLPKNGNFSLLNLSLYELGFHDEMKGLFVVKVESNNQIWVQATQLVSLSDIGIIVKKGINHLHLLTNSITSGTAVSGVNLKIISSNNQVLKTVTTDKNGVASITDYDKVFKGFNIAMVIAQKGDDFNFIELNKSTIDLSSYDVGGKTTAFLDYDLFVYGPRNLYRPGDSVFFNAILRKMNFTTENPVLLKFKVLLPTGKTLQTFRKETNNQGSAEIAFKLPDNIITGTYTLDVYSGNDVLLKTAYFGVEEFMPDRLKVKTTFNKNQYLPGEIAKLSIQANNMYGPPATDKNVETELIFTKQEFNPKGYNNYNFHIATDYSQYFESQISQAVTDESGKADMNFSLPVEKGIGILRVSAYTSVFDETGRPVNRVLTTEIHTQSIFLGLKRNDTWVDTRKPLNFYFVALNRKAELLKNVKINVQIVRHYYETVAERRYGRIYYNSQKNSSIELEKTVIISGKNSFLPFTPRVSGEYEIRIWAENASGYVNQSFYAYGWGDTEYSSFEVDKEGEIIIEADKETYNTGETAELLFKTPFEGRILVSVEKDNLIEYKYLETKNRAASMTLNLSSNHVPNIYISATAIRKIKDNKLPMTVAHGVCNVKVENLENILNVEIFANDKSESGKKQTIKVKSEAGAEITISVVDEGILQLTNYNSPDPYQYFYAKRALEVTSSNIYRFLYPELKASSTGGDLSIDMSKRVNPLANKRITPLSFYSRTLKADAKGFATFTVNLPRFSGAARIMAVAYKNMKFGSAEKEMKIADPLVVSPVNPGFLSPGDKLEFPVSIANTTSKSITANIKISAKGPVKIKESSQTSATLKPGQEKQIVFYLVADHNAGIAEVTIQTTSANTNLTDKVSISVRPSYGLQKFTASGAVVGGKTLNFSIENNFLEQKPNSKIVFSKTNMVEFAQNINYLINYPYGCLEQTVSTAFVQVYLKDIIKALQIKNTVNRAEIDFNVQEAIYKVESLQQYDGSFAYWPGSYYANPWASVFATHFLLEAKKAGFIVQEDKLKQAYNFLSDVAKNNNTSTWYYYNENNQMQFRTITARHNIYALFVLALAQKPLKAQMNFYKSNLESLTSDSRMMLAAAYALIGDGANFNNLCNKNWDNNRTIAETGGSFASYLRDISISLYVLTEVNPQHKMVAQLSKLVSAEFKTKQYFSTQENIFALLAMGKLAKLAHSSDITANVLVDNKNKFTFDGKNLNINNVNNKNISITTTGKGVLYYYWEAEGTPVSGAQENYQNMISISKKFYDRFGNQLQGNSFAQNDLIVVELSVRSLTGKDIENVAITDILPACFEIENSRINPEREYGWMKNQSLPDYLDIRDDRINMFATISNLEKKFYYVVRIVNRGEFKGGQASADAMYIPEYRAFTSTGIITVK